MKTPTKVSLILAGYAIAAVVAGIVVAQGPNANDPGGMAAFGDLLYFVAVFSTLGSVPTGFALWFLKPYRKFWIVLATIAVTLAAAGVAAAVTYAMAGGTKLDPTTPWGLWAELTPLWMLAAPVLAGVFALAGVIAPVRGPRWALLSAAAVEAATAAYFFTHLFNLNRST